jgi:integrase
MSQQEVKKLPKGIRWARDKKRLLIYLTENGKPKRYICDWKLIKSLRLTVKESTRLAHPGVELATDARIALLAKIQQRQREGVIMATLRPETKTVASLLELVKTDYAQRGRTTWRDCECRWRCHLKPFFADLEIPNLNTSLLDSYVAERQAEKTKDGRLTTNGTIQRELSLLKRMYRLGARKSPPLVHNIPFFPKLAESTPRQGFLTQRQYDQLREHASELWLRAILAVAFNFAWRKSELLNLRVHQVDLDEGCIRLGTSKNGDPRVIVMTGEVHALVTACCERKGPLAHVFSRDPDGRDPIRDFRGAWRKLFVDAGLPYRLFHDMRRSGAKTMIESGIDEKVCMEIGGWKTAAVFKRYRIVDTHNIREAAKKIEAHAEELRARFSADTKTDTGATAAKTGDEAFQ